MRVPEGRSELITSIPIGDQFGYTDVVPQCGGPWARTRASTGDSRQEYGQILVRIVLGRLGSACSELFGGGLISGMDEGTPLHAERLNLQRTDKHAGRKRIASCTSSHSRPRMIGGSVPL